MATDTAARTRCQMCGAESVTQFVVFHRAIGALVLLFRRRIKGWLCRSCINKYFRSYTLVSVATGWLGVISLFYTVLFLIPNNLFYYFRARRKLGGDQARADGAAAVGTARAENEPSSDDSGI